MSKAQQAIKILAHCFSGIVLFEDSGTWQSYSNDLDFQEGKEIAMQGANESFEDFILRSARIIVEKEKVEHVFDRSFTVDIAIYCPAFWVNFADENKPKP